MDYPFKFLILDTYHMKSKYHMGEISSWDRDASGKKCIHRVNIQKPLWYVMRI